MVELLKVIIPSLVTIIVVYLGYRYAISQFKFKNRVDFYLKQINEFYAPILGLRKEILAKSQIRLKIENASDEAWKEKCEREERRQRNSEECFDGEKEFEDYQKIIDYNNTQLKNDLIPKYKSIMSIFTNNYWLAEPSTRKWYSEYCEFVEIWNRCMNDKLPNDVVRIIGHNEKKLWGFYEDIEKQVDILRDKIKKG